MKEQTNFLDTSKITVFESRRIENLLANAKLATLIESKGITIELTFTNKGKLDNSSVCYAIPLTKINADQIYKLLSYKRGNNNERRQRKNGNHSNRVSQRS